MTIQFILLTAVFLWAGCILAISFMESWLKFRAPGVTLPVGLSIGKLVFNALNKMEWLFAITILICSFFNKPDMNLSIIIWLGIILLLLLLQSFWLLPQLDARARKVISGKPASSSSLHWYFVIAETVKLIFLFMFGFELFQVFIAK